MKAKTLVAMRREYPHVVYKGARVNSRWTILVSNDLIPPLGAADVNVFTGPGLLDRRDKLTDLGRTTILARITERAKTSAARYCIVWGPESCTWIDGDGSTVDGRRPPKGEVSDPYMYDAVPLSIEWVFTLALPEGCPSTHLCIRRVDENLVEIALGEAMLLGDFSDPALPGFPDPAEKLLDEDGALVLPRTYRGQQVTGMTGEWIIDGPVQPIEHGIFLRNPWPEDVAKTCQELAGLPLPRELTAAAWRAIDPEDPSMIPVGVLAIA